MTSATVEVVIKPDWNCRVRAIVSGLVALLFSVSAMAGSSQSDAQSSPTYDEVRAMEPAQRQAVLRSLELPATLALSRAHIES